MKKSRLSSMATSLVCGLLASTAFAVAVTPRAFSQEDVSLVSERAIRERLDTLSTAPSITLTDLQQLIKLFEDFHRELTQCQEVEASLDSYYKRWDRETTLLQNLEAWIKKTDLQPLLAEKAHVQFNSPLIGMALIRGEATKQQEDKLFDPWRLIEDATKRGRPLREVEILQEHFAKKTADVLKSANRSNDNCQSALRTRIIELKIAASRFYLELPPEVTGASTIGDQNYYSPLRTVYRGARTSLFELNHTYLEHRIKGAPEKKIQFDLDWLALGKGADATQNQGVITYRLKSPLYIPPGVYTTSSEVAIYAPEVRFHPNAVILAPGLRVTINTGRLVAPWIDVSGEAATSLDGNHGGHVIINLEGPNFELGSAPLLVAMGSSGRWLECDSETPVQPGNGGNSGTITVRGGPSLWPSANFLNIPGIHGGVFCNGITNRGNPGVHSPPNIIGREGAPQ